MAEENNDNNDAPKETKEEDEKEAAKDLTIEQGTGEVFIPLRFYFIKIRVNFTFP